jgi:hypothetical protein
LLPGLRPDLVQRLPEAERTIAGGELRVEHEPVLVAQPEQQLAPALGALSKTILDRQQLLPALGVGADENQDALPIMLEPRREIDAVGPEIDIASGREVTRLPVLVLVLPSGRQASHGRRRQTRRLGAEQRCKGLLELPGRDALQVKPGQQLLDVLRPPKISRQHRRGEPDPRRAAIPAVADLRAAHCDRPDPGLQLTLRRMAIAYHPPTAPIVDDLGTRGDEPIDFDLDRAAQHATGTLTQDHQQRIVGDAAPWPRQPDNDILIHGVSFPGEVAHHRGYAASRVSHQIWS